MGTVASSVSFNMIQFLLVGAWLVCPLVVLPSVTQSGRRSAGMNPVSSAPPCRSPTPLLTTRTNARLWRCPRWRLCLRRNVVLLLSRSVPPSTRRCAMWSTGTCVTLSTRTSVRLSTTTSAPKDEQKCEESSETKTDIVTKNKCELVQEEKCYQVPKNTCDTVEKPVTKYRQ